MTLTKLKIAGRGDMEQATATRPMFSNLEGLADGALLDSSHYNFEASDEGAFITSSFTSGSKADSSRMFETKDADNGDKHFFSSHLFVLLS